MKDLSVSGYTVTDLCALTGISRQGYYKRLAKKCDKIEHYSKLEEIVIGERDKIQSWPEGNLS